MGKRFNSHYMEVSNKQWDPQQDPCSIELETFGVDLFGNCIHISIFTLQIFQTNKNIQLLESLISMSGEI